MNPDLKYQISTAIQNFSQGKLFEHALQFFKALGYPTPIQAPLDDPSWKGFEETYLHSRSINEKLALTEDWKYINILFQLTDDAMRNQVNMFTAGRVDNTIMISFLFFVLELKKDNYTKTELSQVTREVNKIFAMPAIILFKTGDHLTLSVINRRLHKRDEGKDVLEKVTLIKDISIANPHRAHIEILFDLSFNELRRKHGFTSFVELHKAWEKTLDIKELNKRFFRELFNWYHWAVRSVRFPNKVADDKDDMQFNQEAVIRMLTRLIFIWFIKEKSLVPDTLFDSRFLKTVLKNFNPSSKDQAEYYRAILQNLFFATLNTPMNRDITEANKDEKRGFLIEGMPGGKANPHYTDQTRYRYKESFINEETALDLFADIPFLNGGLFECLDYAPEDGQEEIRIDGFSSKAKKQAFVPNILFFGEETTIDLNEEYGTKNKPYKVKGLIHIFNGYKFTITENTPLEEEVALDPELLGKVFENLLATYNPETQTTARKQTGSFYTPREIVNYMVDESLIAYLSGALDARPQVESQDFASPQQEDRIRRLFSPTDLYHDFTEAEIQKLIHALSHCRILDPACGSGAFPMGILHRMVDLLNKLDPENKYWKEIQKERALAETKDAYNIVDQADRNHRLEEINKAFDDNINNPDYARKLFLIESCIYGVDIQQIAVQIAKLRFFISLVAEQKVDNTKPNRNILSMPNLETKFVAANTLIALEKPAGQLSLMAMDPAIEAKEKELRRIREKIFFTRRYHDKKKLKLEEKKCREDLKKVLIGNNMSKSAAEQMAGWNPFDPLKSSPYFDIETMFGFEGGFDLVIGNPPYISNKDLPKKDKAYYEKNYIIATSQYDLFCIFIENSIKILTQNGVHSFIIPDSFLGRSSFTELRLYILRNTTLKSILHFNKVFEAIVSNIVYVLTKKTANNSNFFLYKKADDLETWLKNNISLILVNQAKIINNIDAKILHISDRESTIIQNIFSSHQKLEEIALLWRGEELSKNADIIDDIPGPNKVKILDGASIDRYFLTNHFKYIKKSKVQKPTELYSKRKICVRQLGVEITAAYDNNGLVNVQSIYNILTKESELEFILAILNSNVINYLYQKLFRDKLQFPRILLENLKCLPIPNHNQGFINLFQQIVRVLINGPIKYRAFLENLLNKMVYELYFPNEIQSAGCEVLKHLQHLPELKEEWDDAKKLAVIEKVYKEFSEPSHPVSIAMAKMKEVEEVRIIEESVQRVKGKGGS